MKWNGMRRGSSGMQSRRKSNHREGGDEPVKEDDEEVRSRQLFGQVGSLQMMSAAGSDVESKWQERECGADSLYCFMSTISYFERLSGASEYFARRSAGSLKKINT
jgi:hypothetical protein